MSEELDIADASHLFEVACPNALTRDPLKDDLAELYDAIQPHFQRLLKRPDGARIFQLVFGRVYELG
jgi:hypothetical protein